MAIRWYQSKVVQRTKANHNQVRVACNPAKLVSIKSSSKNESKSQPANCRTPLMRCWYQSKVVQRTKANHNQVFHLLNLQVVGINQKQFKERKQITTQKRLQSLAATVGINQKQFKERKQITTRRLGMFRIYPLVSIKSSSKNESKSQPLCYRQTGHCGWYQSKVVQRTKANHNKVTVLLSKLSVGINQKQFKERKQITTVVRVGNRYYCWYQSKVVQRTKANHNKIN